MIQIDRILEQIETLPPLPDTAMKLVAVVNEPSSTMDDIVEAVKYDPAVTTEVLRLCNSAYFGLSRKVTSLNDAMVYLGTVKVLQLVMAVHTGTLLRKPQVGYGLEPGVLWKHSVAVALASAAVGQKLRLPYTGLLFTAGLLHDIGKVILNQYVAEEFTEIARRVTQDKLTFLEAEQQVLGFSHAEIGGRLAEKWQLPEPIVRCVYHHHSPAAINPPDPLVDAVYVANTICLLLGIGLGEDGLSYRADEEVMRRHTLTERDLETIGLQITIDLKQVEQMFDNSPHAEATTVAVGK
ncbi:MAG: HDOD domain-containing protein [Phycisphaerae bacterium]|nr:HDOD domain-containing protein [Phycisphaerae bacterium]